MELILGTKEHFKPLLRHNYDEKIITNFIIKPSGYKIILNKCK